MHGLTGTWRLIRLGLRLDRIKLPIIIGLLTFVMITSVSEVARVYGESEQSLISYAATTAPSVVGRVFAGPIDGPYLGSVVLNETYLFTALAVAFMSTLTVVRHTRQNEETNRTELIGSTIVSKHAPLVSAFVIAVLANIVFGFLTTLSFIFGDLSVEGSVLTGLAMMATGICFASIAAVAAQLTDSARGANALCALVIGIAFILRGIGDSTGTLVNNGLGVQSSFLSWLSPLGWGQQIYPFTEQNIWVFGFFAILTLVCISASVYLMTKRDIGIGIFPTKLGRARAKSSLLSVFGLAKRMQLGILKGWSAAVIVLGAAYGLTIREFEGLLEQNDELKEVFAELGDNINDAFLGVLISFMAITIAGYAAQALLRMRAEEASGQLETVLSANVGRTKWLMSHLSFVAGGILFLSALTALSMGVTYIVSTSAGWSELGNLLAACLNQAPAIFAFAGFVVAVFAFLPTLTVPIAWGGFAACILVLQLGLVLGLPQWVLNISPFVHLPAMPANSFALTPVLWLSAVAVTLTAIGIVKFRRRDIVL